MHKYTTSLNKLQIFSRLYNKEILFDYKVHAQLSEYEIVHTKVEDTSTYRLNTS